MSADPSPIRLVCFDLGGVVIRICRSWDEACVAAGMPLRDNGLWQRSKPARRRLTMEFQTGRIDVSTFATRLSEHIAGLYSPAEIIGAHHALLIEEYAGIGDLIGRIHDAGLDTAALSNTTHDHWGRLTGFPAVMRLRHLLASHQLGLHKPDPMIYRRLEQQVGYNGGEIVFFDDTPDNVSAAASVGWRGHVIDPEADTAQQVEATLREYGVL